MATSNAIWNDKTRAEWRKRAEDIRAEHGLEGAVSCHVFLRALDTCDGLAAQRDKAAQLLTDDMLHAGQQLTAARHANKWLQEENARLKRLLGGVLGDESPTRMEAHEIKEVLDERLDGFFERHAALLKEMFDYDPALFEPTNPGEDDANT